MNSGGRACTVWAGTGACGAPARLYPAGWRCDEHAPAALAGRPEPPAASIKVTRIPAAAPGACRYCGDTAYRADDDGPVHECCHAWRAAIAAGYPCPSCQIARVIAKQDPEKPVRLPRLTPLPSRLPDGRPFIPGLPVNPPLKQAQNGRRTRP